ncbi:MAG: hypothetical protein ACE5GZ_05765 [Gammaproteobacteria bacterium]
MNYTRAHRDKADKRIADPEHAGPPVEEPEEINTKVGTGQHDPDAVGCPGRLPDTPCDSEDITIPREAVMKNTA